MNPLLLTDFYKIVHSSQYPEGTEYLTSYYVPRMSRIDEQYLIMFGLQEFIIKNLIEGFGAFFNAPVEEVLNEYNRLLTYTLGEKNVDLGKIRKLHALGYLPLEVRAIDEGTRVPVKVPMIEITNTHPEFAWVVNAIETLLSCSTWNAMLAANLGDKIRNIVREAYEATGCDKHKIWGAISEFSMRGQESLESSQRASAAWLLSHCNTATIPAIPYLEKYYFADVTKESVGYGLPSTEHSVMCSNFSVDGDERTLIKKLLTEIYPTQTFSMVSDSYDYWNVIDNILPSLKDEIMAHEGTLLVRGDSGDPVEIVAGKPIVNIDVIANDVVKTEGRYYNVGEHADLVSTVIAVRSQLLKLTQGYNIIQFENVLYLVHFPTEGNFNDYTMQAMNLLDMPSEVIGTVASLYREFGGTKNEEGYITLDSHVKAMYGDSITPIRMKEIFKRLKDKGFAANCVSLGVGSFSFQAVEGYDGRLYPNTRDTFGIAVKTTHGVINGQEIFIKKDPKTDNGNFKTSHEGLCHVYHENGEIKCVDQLTREQRDQLKGNLLHTVFKNGKLTRPQTLKQIRIRLHGALAYDNLPKI